MDRVYAAVGTACWLCGFTRGDAGQRVLDFHHVDRATKGFPLNRRCIVNFARTRIAAELRKCVLLCANCHGEVEAGLVDGSRILQLYTDGWRQITFDIDADRT